jgi:pyruvate dehydrogenase E2 component (dihydrolipoamide acetyltransferase)
MPTEFTLPELGENVTAGDVVRILVKPGDGLTKDQPVLELETDKATIEVPSTVSGTVKDVKVKTGEKVKVGQAILVVDEGGGAAAEKPASAGPKAQPSGAAEEGGLSQQATTDRREPEEVEPEETEAEEPQPRPDDRPRAARGSRAAARSPETSDEAPRQKRGEVVDISRSRPAAAAQAPAAPEGIAPPAAPSVRRLARELGVDIRQVPPSGVGGRLTIDDVQAFVRQAMGTLGGGTAPAPASAPAAAQPLPDFTKWGDVERKPMSNIRRKTAEHLAHAWNAIPHVTQHDKADITGFEALRKQFGPRVERAGGKLTVTAVALKIAAAALKRFPQFAASIDPARGQLIYKKYAHIGVAADTDRGLLVPVIRDVDSKSITELAVELAKASEKARAGKLTLDEMSGGVFTITNLGGIGGTSFTPIVNWPEVAILGMSRGGYEPFYDGQQFQPRQMLPLSLSYDHRVIDGADAARFLRWVAEAFEQPALLVL